MIPQPTISPREQEVLHLIAHEHSTKMIAQQLYISEHTVVSHRKNLLAKLEVSNSAGLIRRAFEVGLMKVGQVAATIMLMLLINLDAHAQDDFISIWKTDNPGVTNDTEIRIPATGTYDITWQQIGNPSNQGAQSNVTGAYILKLPSKGTYEVAISKTIKSISFNNGGDKGKIIEVTQWGTAKWTSFDGLFSGCINLSITAEDEPILSSVSTMKSAFAAVDTIIQDITGWDVSNVTNMRGVFNTAGFNQDIGDWDISGVTDMLNMLRNTPLSTRYYDDILRGWESQSVQSGINLGAQGLDFCNGSTARSALMSDHSWSFTGDNQLCKPFVTTWVTDNPGTSLPTEITIPTTGVGYSYDIDFGNDGSIEVTGQTGNYTHDFGSTGTYVVAIYGDFPRIFFNASGDAEKIISIDQWGDIAWQSMNKAFEGCSNVSIEATDGPDLFYTTDMSYMLSESGVNQDISHWDVSRITNMFHMFSDNESFNQSLAGWDVSNVVNMEWMFNGASSFNQDLSSWVVSNVNSMAWMFFEATSFNSSLAWSDMSSVTDLSTMFFGATAFNQDLSTWDVSNVTDMSIMFEATSSFNQDLSTWDVSNVESMEQMFYEATAFNGNVDWGEMTNLESARLMFFGASSFNQDISGWDLSGVTDMSNFLNYTNMSIANYDATLIGWEASGLHLDNVDLGAVGLEYCASGAARQRLMVEHGWTFDDDGPTQGGVNDWLGNSELNWNDSDANWSSMTIPSQCHDVTLPVGSDITIQSGESGYGGTLDIEAGAIFEVELGATLDILFVPQ